jgi:hypothetical protein
MAARGGYQIPADLHPDTSRCVTFQLPNDLFYIANFWGAIGELAKWTSYQRTGDDSGLQAANVMAVVIDNARENFLNECNEISEPEKDIIREIIYRNVEEDLDDDCEGDDIMCVKCGDALRYDKEKKAPYYIDENCNKVYISGGLGIVDPITGVGDWDGEQPAPEAPTVPHDNPLYQSADSLKCAKATALVEEMWNVLKVHESIEEISTFLATVTAITDAIAAFAPFPPARATALVMANTLHGLLQQAALEEIKTELEAITADEDFKSELICDIVPRMVAPIPILEFSTDRALANHLEAADIRVAIKRFDEMLAELDVDHDQAMVWLNVFPITSWQEIVTEKISETECGCDDFRPYEPPEEPATEPEVGEFGLYAGEVVGSIATSMTPAGSRAHGTPRGTKVSETKYTAPPYDAGIDQHATIFVMWEATEMLTQVGLDMLWKYTGSPSDGSNQAVWDFKFYYSTGESSNWQLLPGFVGELASNDSAAPGQFFGAVNFQPIPWDSALMSTDMLYIGVWMRFGIPSDNTLGIIPGGEFTIQTFKAKADSGGNYRAAFVPLEFVPKTL